MNIDVARNIKIWKCKRCGHRWADRKNGKRPHICPKCRKYTWNE